MNDETYSITSEFITEHYQAISSDFNWELLKFYAQ